MRTLAVLLLLWLAAGGAAADPLPLAGEFVQGGLARGQVPPGSSVRFAGREVRVAADGSFVIGFGRDFAAAGDLRVRHPDGGTVTHRLAIAPRQYQVQRIDGLPERMVTPDATALQRIQREAALIAGARATDSPQTWFAEGFVWPLVGRVSGVYGSQRILNGEPRQPHYGIDIAAPAGAPVTAPAAGRVLLAEPDLYFTGGTVMLDHGHGLTSVFSHLSAIEVGVGDLLRRGDRLGRVGATGRATGPHLDWRVNWFDQRLDPQLLAGPMPASSHSSGHDASK